MARSNVPTYQEIHMVHGETFKMFDRDPFVDVFISGKEWNIYSFRPHEVKPAQAPVEHAVSATFHQYRRGSLAPQRGQFKAILDRVGDPFTLRDVETALTAAVGDRVIKTLSRSYRRRAATLVRRMLKRKFIVPTEGKEANKPK
jgi:hypothetical protein